MLRTLLAATALVLLGMPLAHALAPPLAPVSVEECRSAMPSRGVSAVVCLVAGVDPAAAPKKPRPGTLCITPGATKPVACRAAVDAGPVAVALAADVVAGP